MKPIVQFRKAASAIVLALTVAVASASPASAAGSQPVGLGTGWTKVWGDEFNGTKADGTGLDRARWNDAYCYGKTMNNVQILPSNVTVANGVAALRLSDSTHGAMILSAAADGCPAPSAGHALVPGEVAEFRVLIPGTGTKCLNWGGPWTTGNGWPLGGESDLGEPLDDGHLTQSYHGQESDASGNPTGPRYDVRVSTMAGSLCGSWHVFSIYRGDTWAIYYLDGVQSGDVVTHDNASGQALAVNAGIALGAPATTNLSKPVAVDYVRVWSDGSSAKSASKVSAK